MLYSAKREQVQMERAFLMVSLYSTGMTVEEIGHEFGVSHQRVSEILKKAGVSFRSRYRGQADPIAVCRAAETSSSLEECALKAKTTPSRAKPVLVALGKWPAYDKKWNAAKNAEKENRKDRAKLRLLHQLAALARELGRTPGMKDLRDAGIWGHKYFYHFGSLREAQRLAGLEPNQVGWNSRKRKGDEAA